VEPKSLIKIDTEEAFPLTSAALGLSGRRSLYDRRPHSSNRLPMRERGLETKKFLDESLSLTVVVSLEHFDFLLVVGATEKLALLDDILIAFL
jgi:hypothetical protein